MNLQLTFVDWIVHASGLPSLLLQLAHAQAAFLDGALGIHLCLLELILTKACIAEVEEVLGGDEDNPVAGLQVVLAHLLDVGLRHLEVLQAGIHVFHLTHASCQVVQRFIGLLC